MSRNYDFPPASDNFGPPAQLSSTDASRRRGRWTDENAQRIHDEEIRQYLASHGGTRRQLHEDGAVLAPRTLPTNILQTELLASRLRRRINSTRLNPLQMPNIFNTHAPDSLASINTDLPPPMRIGSPDMTLSEYSGEAEVNHRRKRRKLDANRVHGAMRKVSYEWKGRVKPGKLQMEIHDCDGGLHVDSGSQHQRYSQQNILRNDVSVYCTESSQCNVVLRHAGETCFTLKKIVIKAPERGFTAPIQEGLIFIAMDASNLRRRTDQYNLLPCKIPKPCEESGDSSHSSPEGRPRSRRRDSLSRTIPPPVSNHIIPPLSELRAPAPDLDFLNLTDTEDEFYSSDDGITTTIKTQRIENRSPIPARSLSGYQVTTHCDPPTSDEEEESSPQALADRHHREHRRSSFPITSDDDNIEDHLERALRARPLGLSSSRLPRRRRGLRRVEPSRLELRGSKHRERSREPPLPPHAKFFIEQEKSVVSISFDPPVCGRYVLLKLWSPNEGQNIDIQSIISYGFAGPRLFPSITMM